MSNRPVLVATIFALLLGGNAFPQTRQKDFSKNESEIKALYDQWAKARSP